MPPARHTFAACTITLVAATASLAAQQLSLRTFTARDGLAHSRINCVHQDRRGFLWFGTWEGLSRFDGRTFVNFGTADGLPVPLVDCIAEDAAGRLWIGTHGGGVARMRSQSGGGGAVFEAFHVTDVSRGDDVGCVWFDPQDVAWFGSSVGVFRAAAGAASLAVENVLTLPPGRFVGAAARDGFVFFCGDVCGVVRAGAIVQVPSAVDAAAGIVTAVVRDGDDVVVASERGVHTWSPAAPHARPRPWALPLAGSQKVTSLVRDGDGVWWIGTTAGLLERRGDAWRQHGVRHGLPDDHVRALFVDGDDNLWIGTHRGGVARLADRGIATFAAGEGFADVNVVRVASTPDGRLFASTNTAGIYEVFADRVVHQPGTGNAPLATVHMRFSCDRDGGFWLGSEDGLWHCPGPQFDAARCERIGGDDVMGSSPLCAPVSQDRAGGLWCGTLDRRVYHRPANGSWRLALSLADFGDATACRICADEGEQGMLFATFDNLWRFTGGVATKLELAGPALLRPRCVFHDSRGWTWIGTRYLGVFGLRPPEAGGLLHLTTAAGLASDAVWSIAEDRHGYLYFGTGRGVDRADARQGTVHRFGGDGDPANAVVNHLLVDSRGDLWAATSAGLSRFDGMAPPRPHAPPRVYVVGITVDGGTVAFHGHDIASAMGLSFAAGTSHIAVECLAPLLHGGRPVRYQHRLGADASWSPPSELGTVQFANVAPGEHRLQVRAVDGDGRCSEQPAEVTFVVLPPWWRRAWVVAIAALGLAAAVVAWHRLRLARAVATERLRTQIATDLHDDVGAGLVQIAILGEVARQRAEPELASRLGEVTELARSLRESMSDIVWALAKGHATLADVVQRLRHVADRLLEVDGTHVDFRVPPAGDLAAVRLSLDQRRQTWLWCREALTNVARHAAATAVTVELTIAGGELVLTIRDDGRGFDAAAAADGNGVANLHRRASRLGGRMQLTTAPGAGTTVALTFPLAPR